MEDQRVSLYTGPLGIARIVTHKGLGRIVIDHWNGQEWERFPFLVKLSDLERVTMRPCPDCDGSGADVAFDGEGIRETEPCERCDHTGLTPDGVTSSRGPNAMSAREMGRIVAGGRR